MRLTDNQILDGLLHPKQLVRDAAINYFIAAQRTEPEITRKIIQAVDRFGWDETFEWLHQVSSFELDEHSFPWVLDQLYKIDQDADRNRLQYHLSHMLSFAPAELLRQSLKRIHAIPVIDEQISKLSTTPDAASIIEQRLQIDEKSAETCWQELLECCDSMEDEGKFPDAKVRWCEHLVRKILQDQAFAESLEPKVNDQLANTDIDSDYGSFLTVGMMIFLAGHMRWQSSIENLFCRYEIDSDWYSDEITTALTRIGTDDVLKHVAERYPDQPWYVRNYCSTVFENIHTDSVIKYLPILLETEQDDDIRANLGAAAAAHYDDRGIDIARAVFLEAPEDPEREIIIRRLTAFSYMADFDLPERDQWEQDLHQRKVDFEKRRPSIESMFSHFENSYPQEIPQRQPAVSATTTIRNHSTKIGRNDLCPCGSGRKYKKCCMRK